MHGHGQDRVVIVEHRAAKGLIDVRRGELIHADIEILCTPLARNSRSTGQPESGLVDSVSFIGSSTGESCGASGPVGGTYCPRIGAELGGRRFQQVAKVGT